MSHLDEGTLHALLDGELDLTEVSEIQMHLGSCVACGSRLQEVKQFLAEADRLVGEVEMPAGAAAPPPRVETPPQPEAPRRPPRPLPQRSHEPDGWEEQILLLPDSSESVAWRTRWLRRLRWVAVFAMVLLGGQLLTKAFTPGSSLPSDRDLTTTAPAVPPAVASPKDTARPEAPRVVLAEKKPTRPAAQNRALAAKTAQRPKTVVAEPRLDSALQLRDRQINASADSSPAADTAPSEPAPAAGSVAESTATDSIARKPSDGNEDLATRRAAAAAMAELDKERRRERAAAATAALPPARPEVQPAADAAPPPRTPEQRAQIYLRIGLDEAVRQLGGPVHVIDGMIPQFIGLTQGRLMPGGDSGRPVVRVVYLDSRGRMILLDQQRLRTGQAPGSAEGSLRWVIGDVLVYLRGEPAPEVLKSLQARVR